MTFRRWFKSTSNRTFIVWPVVLLGAEAAMQRGWPAIHWWALVLLAWGYLQYRLIGNYRTRLGGGGPGLSNPPERIVEQGIYRWMRNPMYLGHLIYLLGLVALFGSWLAFALFTFHLAWFDARAEEDERHLGALFGAPYEDYRRRVRRWIPGIY